LLDLVEDNGRLSCKNIAKALHMGDFETV